MRVREVIGLEKREKSPSVESLALTGRIDALQADGHVTEVRQIETGAICPNPYERPHKYAREDITFLAAQISHGGMSNPLLVENVGTDETPLYQLVCGEKRLRAAIMADLVTVPCAIIERHPMDATTGDIPIPRNCFEEADVISDILQTSRYDTGKLATKLGITKTALENKLYLCHVPPHEREVLLSLDVPPRHCIFFARQNAPTRATIVRELTKEKTGTARAQQIIEEYCDETRREREHFAISDSRPFLNTVKKAVDRMRAGGVAVWYETVEKPDHTEITIRIPK